MNVPVEQQEAHLSKKKMNELVEEIKANEMHVKGLSKLRKQNIVDILKVYYLRNFCALLINGFINKHLFSFFSRKCKALRGNCFENKKKCINDTDFYTLEPLGNIPDNQFYCFHDEKGFYYGFNIFSFKHLLPFKGSRKKCLNPYTRDVVDESIQHTIERLIVLTTLVEPNIKDMNKEPIDVSLLSSVVVSVRNEEVGSHRFLGNAIYPRGCYLNDDQKHVMEVLIEKRKRPTNTRIEDLFYEIDLLGNYTQREWFDELSRHEYLRFFGHLQEFWNRSGNIQSSLKRDICMLNGGDPFYNIIMNSHLLTTEQIREACLLVMENLTFTGKDDESRKMGVIYILINLSYVSENVRNSISWLQ
jgi:hypothetical protein